MHNFETKPNEFRIGIQKSTFINAFLNCYPCLHKKIGRPSHNIVNQYLGAITAFLLSPFKYLFGAAAAFSADLHPLLSLLVTTMGAMVGVFAFVYLGDWIIHRFTKKEKKKFSKFNRFLIKLRRFAGLLGISILTPIILSIPVGCFLAITIEHDKMRIIRYMFFSVIGWGILIFGLKEFFNIKITDYF